MLRLLDRCVLLVLTGCALGACTSPPVEEPDPVGSQPMIVGRCSREEEPYTTWPLTISSLKLGGKVHEDAVSVRVRDRDELVDRTLPRGLVERCGTKGVAPGSRMTKGYYSMGSCTPIEALVPCAPSDAFEPQAPPDVGQRVASTRGYRAITGVDPTGNAWAARTSPCPDGTCVSGSYDLGPARRVTALHVFDPAVSVRARGKPIELGAKHVDEAASAPIALFAVERDVDGAFVTEVVAFRLDVDERLGFREMSKGEPGAPQVGVPLASYVTSRLAADGSGMAAFSLQLWGAAGYGFDHLGMGLDEEPLLYVRAERLLPDLEPAGETTKHLLLFSRLDDGESVDSSRGVAR